MRPTKLVADSKEGFPDAVRQIIDKIKTLSNDIKSIRILEDLSPLQADQNKFRLKAHILKRS